MSAPFAVVELDVAGFPFGPAIRRGRGGRWVHATTRPVGVDLVLFDGRRVRLTTIEAGFETDAISRPWVSRVLGFKPWGKGWPGAVVHDWLLELMRRDLVGRPKMVVDLWFALAAISAGASFPRVLLMFAGVRTRKRRGVS